MKPSFYHRFSRSVPRQPGTFFALSLILAMGVVSCGKEAGEDNLRANKTASGAVSSAFVADSMARPYVRVPKEELISRYIAKLRTGSRSGLRFAKEALGAHGEAAVPAILEGLRLELEKGDATAANFLASLSYTKTEKTHPILLEVLSRHPLPLVRSQALDTIAILKQVELLPGVLKHAQIEAESGPISRMFPCIGKLGGPEAAKYLLSVVEDWLNGGTDPGLGPSAWDNLLLIQGDSALDSIASVLDRVPAIMKAYGTVRLLEGGRKEWQEDVQGLLDFRSTPSPGIRRKAVSALAGVGNWQGVMEASDDPDLQVRFSVIDALGLPDADVSGAALAFLQKSASGPNEDASYPALRVLLKRGDLTYLEPWLAQVKGYPTKAGSINALKLFLQPEISHPRLVPMMFERWDYCESDFRIDITRVLAKHASPETNSFLEKVILDPEEDPDVRLYAIASLGNSGESCIPSLFRVWEKQPSPEATDRLFGAMLRYPKDKRTKEFCFDLIRDPNCPDEARAMMLTSFPLAFREEAYLGLLAAIDATEREEVRVFIERILHEFF
jgi:HEAT repeat protein